MSNHPADIPARDYWPENPDDPWTDPEVAERLKAEQNAEYVRRADSLNVGDTFSHSGVTVTILRSAEPYKGRDMATFAFWCSRADTGAEGWVSFGSDGVVRTQIDSSGARS